MSSVDGGHAAVASETEVLAAVRQFLAGADEQTTTKKAVKDMLHRTFPGDAYHAHREAIRSLLMIGAATDAGVQLPPEAVPEVMPEEVPEVLPEEVASVAEQAAEAAEAVAAAAAPASSSSVAAAAEAAEGVDAAPAAASAAPSEFPNNPVLAKVEAFVRSTPDIVSLSMGKVKAHVGKAAYKEHKQEIMTYVTRVIEEAMGDESDPADDSQDEDYVDAGDDDGEPRPAKRRKRAKASAPKFPDLGTLEEEATKAGVVVAAIPRRPRTSYILFCDQARAQLKEEQPDLPQKEVMKTLGARWKALTEEEKAPFIEKQNAERQAWKDFETQHPRVAAAVVESRKTKKSARRGGAGSRGGGRRVPTSVLDSAISDMNRRRKRRKRDDEDVDLERQKSMTDTVLIVKKRMDIASSKDVAAYASQQPAIFKLNMLQDVEDMLGKQYLHETFLEQDILREIALWLTPLSVLASASQRGSSQTPRGAAPLPPLKLRKALYKILATLPLDGDHLREHSIPKTVMYLIKHPEETLENKKFLRRLVEDWVRIITKVSTKYTALRDAEEEDESELMRRRANSAKQYANASSGAGVRIPQQAAFDYVKRVNQPSRAESNRAQRRTLNVQGSESRSRLIKKFKTNKKRGRT